MHTIYVDPTVSDKVRRERLYDGQVFAFTPRPAAQALCDHARTMIQDAFGDYDPRTAQYEMAVEEYVSIVAPLKPKFIHHPRSKELARDLLEDLGCDLNKTYLDVPRLRMVTSDGYLTSGVGYAHHPHRDTWYAAPMCQLNWWLPIYDIETEASMAFHPQYWDRAVENGSSEFNYYEWNRRDRKDASTQIKKDTSKQPKPEEPMELEPQVRVVTKAGGIVLFSAAQMHSTVPNTSGFTRYSIDFRTVHIDDVLKKEGAPNVDSEPTGTSLRDFMRASDLRRVPEDVAQLYDKVPIPEGLDLVFKPTQ
ncbi:MAG: hypothetical protein GVY18_09180 [Bacteroidetes bacterium]|jgi:hypothetical protein|nr:hypothetical protein [Bacteroidota bacterium]